VGAPRRDRRQNFLVDFLFDVVSFRQVWFGSVHFAGDMVENPSGAFQSELQ